MKALLSNPQQAEASLVRVREAVKARTNNVPALMVLAAVESRKGNALDAGRIYENILSIYTSFTPAMRELALLCFGGLKNHEKAHTLASRVREADRSDAEIARILGFTSYERGEFTRSAELLAEYCRQRSQDAEAFYQLGLAHQKLKQVKECKDALNKALSLQPNAAFAAEAKRILGELK
jgi:tetratricopeptide (TPR) repeat protein